MTAETKKQLQAEISVLNTKISTEEKKDIDEMNHARITSMINHRMRLEKQITGRFYNKYLTYEILK